MAWNRRHTMHVISAGCAVVLHAALTAPAPNTFNWGLVRDVSGVVAAIPRGLDWVTAAIEAADPFGYKASRPDRCVLKVEPAPPAVLIADYQAWAAAWAVEDLTPESVARDLGEPFCFTESGVERRVIEGERESRILEIAFSPSGGVRYVDLVQ